MWHQEKKGVALTYSGTDGHEHVADDLGVVHHDGLNGSVQHADPQGPLLLLVLQGVLRTSYTMVRVTQWYTSPANLKWAETAS